MKIEIGSEFWSGCTLLNGNGVAELLPVGMDVRYTLCGRTALELVLRDITAYRQLHKAYMPSYCCHTMIEPLISKGVTVEFYDVFFTDTGIGCSFAEDNDCDLVFFMDYFGFLDKNTPRRANRQKAYGKCVVYDATHALFCEDVDYSGYDYVFGSFRKWFNVNAGFCAKASAWVERPELVQNPEYSRQRNTAFEQKQAYMAGKLIEKECFLKAFSLAEGRLEMDYLNYGPDDVSLQVLESVNVSFIRERRCENAVYAIGRLGTISSGVVCSPYRQVQKSECPLFIPLSVKPEKRVVLRQRLIENRVYLPIHWPLSDLHNTNDISEQIYNTELSFVCDQRYDFDDIEKAIQMIRSV